jgi:hypothetical protein
MEEDEDDRDAEAAEFVKDVANLFKKSLHGALFFQTS